MRLELNFLRLIIIFEHVAVAIDRDPAGASKIPTSFIDLDGIRAEGQSGAHSLRKWHDDRGNFRSMMVRFRDHSGDEGVNRPVSRQSSGHDSGS